MNSFNETQPILYIMASCLFLFLTMTLMRPLGATFPDSKPNESDEGCDLIRMTLFGLSFCCLTRIGRDEGGEKGIYRKSLNSLIISGVRKLPHNESQMSSNELKC